VVPGGERVKNTRQYVDELHRAIYDFGICRHSFLIAVGGGAVLDMAGYAAATAHRGVRLIRVPTTVLSQNDSGVGVKNGINAFGRKNFLGVFAPPYSVIDDFQFLTTLEDRDWRAGMAEAVKVALIKDAAFFEFLEQEAAALAARDMRPMRTLIERCAEMHVRHIQTGGDPFETGSSRPLDFGHWAAHKLEQLTNYGLRHGEAVAMGIALDATYSYLAGLLEERDWRRTIALLNALGFDLALPEEVAALSRENPRSLLSGLNEFREHLGGPLTVMLLKRVGQAVEVHEMSDELVRESIELLNGVEVRKR
jgi:3-dehydroquinate synthase